MVIHAKISRIRRSRCAATCDDPGRRGVEPYYVLSKGHQKERVEVHSLLCYWAVRELGLTVTEMARRIEMTPSAVGSAVVRGEKFAKQEGLKIIDTF